MILTDHIHGLGKSVTENWEMFDAICDKKHLIMREIMGWNVPSLTNNSLRIMLLSKIFILSFDQKRDVFQKCGTTEKGSNKE